MPLLKGEHICVSDGLKGQDDHFEKLSALFEDLALASVDVASQLDCDLLSFAQTAFLFGVITLEYNPPVPEPETTPQAAPTPLDYYNRPPSSRELDWDSLESSAEDWLDRTYYDFKKGGGPSRLAQVDNVTNNSSADWPPLGNAPQLVQTSRQEGARNPTPFVLRPGNTSQLVQSVRLQATRIPVGIIYLIASPLALAPPNQVGELNLGIILSPQHRGKGYAQEAIRLVVKYAFEQEHCHRIQVSLLSLSSKDRMTSLLTQLHFGHEGIKRRSFFNPLMGEWQDVTTLAILDTDWAMREVRTPAPKSLWDEMFLRHERERSDLLRWDDDQNRLMKRTMSTETLRAVPLALEPDSCDDSDAGSVISRAPSVTASASPDKGKKRMAPIWSDDGASGSDADSEFEDVAFATLARKRFMTGDHSRRSGPSSPTFSDISLVSDAHSAAKSPPSTPSASGSEWDLLESSSSSSSFGDLD
ncbi:hypothetical protein MSAN_01720600 [Mycena sanguinolenta]|uniref:N-acetyltransferase domain-containing protein n=1 Tax=Mycena sanguinolenta TaxID=230812 RepID=A0A8H6XZM2_9AGAR|nr:hypothetical protein MSAN_01720600 [Mycena sanguinolenta]